MCNKWQGKHWKIMRDEKENACDGRSPLSLAWWSLCETMRLTYVFLVLQQFEQIYLKE